ncbi:MAG: GxxExxY protein [Pirellulaceae bacterium]|nr:GxxExxY protein [Pirellulaceae bacterium]
MHPLFSRADQLTSIVIGAAIEVHRILGPGLLESIYERCLIHELKLRGLNSVNQKVVQIRYKDVLFEENLRFDILVKDCLLIEVKAVEHVLPVRIAAAISYLKLLDLPLGLVINFHVPKLVEGVKRLIIPGANLLDPQDF